MSQPRNPTAIPCGKYVFHHSEADQDGFANFTITGSDGSVISQHPYYKLEHSECHLDFFGTSDQPALLLIFSISQYSSVLLIYQLGESAKMVLGFNGTVNQQHSFRDLNHDGKLEVVGYENRFRYLDYSGADSRSLPVVFCFDASRYRDCTRQFPAVVREEYLPAEKALIDCAGNANACDRGELSSAFTMYYACRSLLGESAAAKRWLEKKLPGNEFRMRRRLFLKIDKGLRSRYRGDLFLNLKNGENIGLE